MQPGDGLILIAERFGVDWVALAELNGIRGPDYFVQPGQILNIDPRDPSALPRTVVVQVGEGLLDIAFRVNVRFELIAAINGIPGPDYFIHPGQVLFIDEPPR